ncbi:hypothetical protein Pint_11383 [Pistacia integerrima]|uniref:Uncharacterized protein n=1 Tax=Pistacia integerrima TaxID=434235 RepID=A0ACC0XGG3_9ROSI|nr:hypothetical protein Pint_11383 [Pistacia integerrima]
MGKAPEPYIPP